jgi:CBS domain-containing protein
MPGTTLIRDVMTKDVVTLAPDMSMADAADKLATHRFGAMPVVDVDGTLLGVLADEDLIVSEARVHVPTFINFLGATIPLPNSMRHLEDDLRKVAGATVRDVMDADPVTIAPDATVEDLATLMHQHDISHVPVVDEHHKVIGIVARGDLVRMIARET